MVLLPNLNLMNLILSTQQIAGVLTPVILIFMILLVNDKRIMGNYVNTFWQNAIAMITVILIVVMTLLLIILQFIP